MDKRLEELEAKLKEYEANREEIKERLEILEQERNTIFINGKPVEYDGKEPLVFEDGKSQVIFENHGATVNMATNGATVIASGIPKAQEIRAYRTALQWANENIAETKEQIETLKAQKQESRGESNENDQIDFDQYVRTLDGKVAEAYGTTTSKLRDMKIVHLGNDLGHMTHGKGLNVELISKTGAYISDEKSRNLGFVPITKDKFGWNHFQRDGIQWNQNKKINLTMEKDEKGQYIKLESKDKGVTARAYLKGEAKPFQELKNEWEMEKRTFQKQKDRSQDKELSMER